MFNPAQPPEGILDPKQPYWPADKVGQATWLRLKGKLTGRRVEGISENFTSYVKLGDADADRLIANIKKYGQYPTVNQNDKYGGAYNNEAYQKWLVEEFLEKPFRQEVNEKIDNKTSDVLDRVFIEAKEEVEEAETKSEVAEIIEDKVEVLEAIKEDMNPPRSEYQIPDPWEGSYTTPKTEKEKKKERRKLKRVKNVVGGKRKRKPSAPPGGGNEPPKPPRAKRSFATKLGGGVRKTGKSLGSTLLDKLESGGPLGENMGPSVLGAGIWIGKKINAAFKDAKKERERAIEAEQNGAEVPPEVKEKGYFIKKSLAHQFGGQAINQTVGAFFENIPSKQSKQKSAFSDKFDYGDGDPNKKKKQNDIKDLATGFRKVTTALRGINRSIDQQIGMLSKLVGETSRVADTLEAIQNAIAKSIDVEIESGSDESMAQQATGDINIPDMDFSGLMGGGDGGIDWFDMLMAADDVRDIKRRMKDGGQKTTRRKGGPKITGDVPKRNRFRLPSFGRRMKFSEGAASVGASVPALIGEAGPEVLIRGGMKKLAEGGIMQGTGSNILSSGLGATKGLEKKAQKLYNVMETAFQVIGSHISGALSALVSAAGPFSGVIAKMFAPLLGGLATVFGLNQGAFAAEINSAAMTEKQGAKILSKFFANFFKLFGFDMGDDEETTDDDTKTTATGDWAPLLDLIASGEGSYDSMYPSENYPEVLKMSIDELVAFQIEKKKDGRASAAVGRYQMLHPETYAKNAGLKTTEIFTPSNQDKMAAAYIENIRGGKDWREGIITDEQFGYKLAAEWAALKQPNGVGRYDKDGRNSSKIPWEKTKEALQKIKGTPTQAARGVVKPTSFLNQVHGVFEMSGPDSGYRVPEEYTGGQPVIGHGLEYLIKFGNKFVILPVVNKEYNVYRDPEKAFSRYEQIGKQGGVEVAGLFNLVDGILGGSKKGPSTLKYGDGYTAPKKVRGWAADESGAEILRTLGGIPVKGASLPEGTVTPVAVPKDTVTGTTGAVVAMVKPVIQYVPVPVPGPERVEYVPANPFVAARASIEMLQLQGLT